MNAARLSMMAVLVAACGKSDDLTAADIFTLSFRGDVAPADGRTRTLVDLCLVSSSDNHVDVSAIFTLSAGAWEIAPDPTQPLVVTTPIPQGSNQCVDLAVISPTDLAPVFVDAQIGNYTRRACLQMTGAPVYQLVLTTSPISLAGTAPTAITVTAKPLGVAGAAVSPATRVTFRADSTPSATTLDLQPTESALDEMGVATAQLVAPPMAETVTIRAFAITPNGPPCPSVVDPVSDAATQDDPGADAKGADSATTLTVTPDGTPAPDATPDGSPAD